MQALKIILIGDTGVGKSQLSRCLMNKEFQDDAQTTIGMEFQSKKFDFEKCIVTSQIWDTAGQERFAGMTRAYYRDAVAAILVYDVCNKDSLIRLETVWLPQLREFGHSKIKLILVGNKADKVVNEGQRDVSVETGIEFAEKHNVDFLEASAFTRMNVEKMFRRVSLSVAKLLPDVKQHLELLSLPEGWLAIMPPPQQALVRETSGGSADLNIGNSGSASAGTSLENLPPRTLAKTSSFNITDSPESFRPIGIGGDSVNRRRSIRRENTSPTSKPHAPKVRYINYWTGEEVDECPLTEADPGLLYTAVNVPPPPVERESSLDLTPSAAQGKKKDDPDDMLRDSHDGRPAPTERSSSVTITGDNVSNKSRSRSDGKVKRCCTIS